MKRVTKAEWQAAVRAGNAGLDHRKTPWMLYVDDSGASVWGQVDIGEPRFYGYDETAESEVLTEVTIMSDGVHHVQTVVLEK